MSSIANMELKVTPEVRLKRARTVTIIGLTINFVLALVKITMFFLYDNLSILADGFDSALDIATTMLGFVAIKISDRPADDDHHFGHSKFENLFSLGIAIILVASSGIIGYQAVQKLINYKEIIPVFSVANIIISSLSIVLKTVLVFINIRVGKKINSPTLVANGLNFRTDILTSFTVLLSVSIAHLTIGSFRLVWVDPTIALIICVVIIITAIKITREAAGVLLDQSPDKETLEKIKAIAREQKGVFAIGNIRARCTGPNVILVDLDVHLDPKITIEEGHEIVCKIDEKIKSQMPVEYIQIHMEPYLAEDINQESEVGEVEDDI